MINIFAWLYSHEIIFIINNNNNDTKNVCCCIVYEIQFKVGYLVDAACPIIE